MYMNIRREFFDILQTDCGCPAYDQYDLSKAEIHRYQTLRDKVGALEHGATRAYRKLVKISLPQYKLTSELTIFFFYQVINKTLSPTQECNFLNLPCFIKPTFQCNQHTYGWIIKSFVQLEKDLIYSCSTNKEDKRSYLLCVISFICITCWSY